MEPRISSCLELALEMASKLLGKNQCPKLQQGSPCQSSYPQKRHELCLCSPVLKDGGFLA